MVDIGKIVKTEGTLVKKRGTCIIESSEFTPYSSGDRESTSCECCVTLGRWLGQNFALKRKTPVNH